MGGTRSEGFTVLWRPRRAPRGSRNGPGPGARNPSLTRKESRSGLFPSAVEQEAPDQQQDEGAYERDHDLAKDPKSDRDVQEPGQPAADDGAQDADHDVPEPTPALAGDHAAGQESRDQAHQDVDQDVFHCAI